jgi:hypothetical protein
MECSGSNPPTPFRRETQVDVTKSKWRVVPVDGTVSPTVPPLVIVAYGFIFGQYFLIRTPYEVFFDCVGFV